MAWHQKANSHRRWSRLEKVGRRLAEIVFCVLVAEIGHYCKRRGLVGGCGYERDRDVDY